MGSANFGLRFRAKSGRTFWSLLGSDILLGIATEEKSPSHQSYSIVGYNLTASSGHCEKQRCEFAIGMPILIAACWAQ